jgi:hypothetical protein
MTEHKKPVRLVGRTLDHSPHVCAFFTTREEEYQVLLPFIKEGFEEGDKAFHVVDPQHRADHLQRLSQAGINVEHLANTGQLEVREWAQAYLRDGRFDQRRMLELVEEVLQSSRTDNFALTRFVAHMEWSLQEFPGVHDLVEYEARLNYLIPKYEDPILCTYDLTQFSAQVIMDILRVHPMVILGGILHENPFYTPADEFLRELHSHARTEPYHGP